MCAAQMDKQELKSLLLSLVRSHPNGKLPLLELKNEFKKMCNLELNCAVQNHSNSIMELLEEFSDVLKISHNGITTMVEYVSGDHITELNRRSKQKYNVRAFNYDSQPDNVRVIYKNTVSNADQSESEFQMESVSQINLSNRPFPPEELNKIKKTESTVKTMPKFHLNKYNKLNSNSDIKTNKLTVEAINKENNYYKYEVERQMRNSASALHSPKVNKYNFELVKTMDQIIPLPIENLCTVGRDVKKIVILEIVNPHRFWFCENEDYKNFRKLCHEMNDFYKTNNDSLAIEAKDLQNNLHVAAFDNGVWHRAKILKVYGGSKRALVFFVDFGGVNDIEVVNLKYLKEKYISLPAIAQRGILAFIQPIQLLWNEKEIHFFKQMVQSNENKVLAKIFYRNFVDNSYSLGLKLKIEDNLVANLMIENKLGVYVKRFYSKNSDELTFDEYENGKLFEISNVISLHQEDSWLPSPASKNKNIVKEKHVQQSSSKVSFNMYKSRSHDKKEVAKKIDIDESVVNCSRDQSSTTFIPSNHLKYPESTNESHSTIINRKSSVTAVSQSKCLLKEMPQQKLFNRNENQPTSAIIHKKISRQPMSSGNFQNSIFTPNHQSSPRSIPQLSSHAASSVNSKYCANLQTQLLKQPRQIIEQNLDSIPVGKEVLIWVNHVDFEFSRFFFYNMIEIHEIKKFLCDFNNYYMNNKQLLKAQDIQVYNDVVVYHNSNYCRGRIITLFDQNFSCLVFLHDFGMIIHQNINEIFYLNKDFIQRQGAVYQGKLNIPLEAPNNYEESTLKFILFEMKDTPVKARIVSIENNCVTLHIPKKT